MINAADTLSEDFIQSEDAFIRDRIVILGRRSSGKTVYLSVLYYKLWNSTSDLRIRALKGANHLELIRVAENLKKDVWPPATQGISENILELTVDGVKKTIVALDYPGEVFTNAFVKEIESKEANILLDHIDHAQGLIVLIDPEHIASGDVDSQIDNNYGLLQAVNRIQNWPDGDKVPIVMVLTKADKNNVIIKNQGGTRNFIVNHLSTLLRDVHGVKACSMSAYHALIDEEQKNRRFTDIEEPLMYCIKKIQEYEETVLEHKQKQRFHKYITEIDEESRKKQTRMNTLVTLAFAFVFLSIVYITIKILPSTVWYNLWKNTFGRLFG